MLFDQSVVLYIGLSIKVEVLGNDWIGVKGNDDLSSVGGLVVLAFEDCRLAGFTINGLFNL